MARQFHWRTTFRRQGLALVLGAVLASSPAPVLAEVAALIDSFEFEADTSLMDWTVNVVVAPDGPSTDLCGYSVRMATVTAIAPDRVRVVTAQVWMVDTSGTTITPAQRLRVATVSDCANVPGMWLLKLAEAEGA